MGLTFLGIELIINRLVNNTSNVLQALGVGNGLSAYSPGDTGLTGTNFLILPCDSGYPQLKDNTTIIMQSTFGPNDANFSWLEWGVFPSTTNENIFSRVEEYSGQKLSGQTFILNIELVFSIGGSV